MGGYALDRACPRQGLAPIRLLPHACLSILLVPTPIHPPFDRHPRPLTHRILNLLKRDSLAGPTDPSGRVIPHEPIPRFQLLRHVARRGDDEDGKVRLVRELGQTIFRFRRGAGRDGGGGDGRVIDGRRNEDDPGGRVVGYVGLAEKRAGCMRDDDGWKGNGQQANLMREFCARARGTSQK